MGRLLQVVVVGRLRPPLDAVGRLYEDRVAALTTFRVDEVAAEPAQRGADQVARREAARIRERLAPGAWRVALDPAGRAPASSDAFARWLGRRLEEPRPTTLLVGGALGLPPDVLAECDERLSLGPLTMPHQLARVVLAEQVYRGLLTLAGHPYPR